MEHPAGAEERASLLGAPESTLLERLDEAPDDPIILARLARKARREGRLVDAAWLSTHALRVAPSEGLVQEEARVLGWKTEGEGAPSPLPLAPAWPWWMAGGVLLVALGVSAWRARDQLGLSALLVGAMAAALVMPPAELSKPSLPSPLESVHEGAPCEARPITWRDGRLLLSATCAGEPRQVVISPTRPGEPAIAHTLRHAITYLGQGGSPEVQALVAHVVNAMAAAEAQGYTVAGPQVALPSRLERWQGADPDLQAKLRVSAGVVAATLWVMLALLWRALMFVARGRLQRALWLPLGLGVIGLALVPAEMRMVYGGYDLTRHLVEGLVPRYGPGALWFYGLPQWLISADHAWVQLLNRLYGVGTLIALIALTRRLFPGEGPMVGVAWLAASLPILYAAFSCESIHVGPALGVLVGIWLATDEELSAPVAGALPWMAAAMTRPELAVMALFAPLLIWGLRGRPGLDAKSLHLPVLFACAALLFVIGIDLYETTQSMAQRSAVALDGSLWGKVLSAGVFQSIIVLPEMSPIILLGLIVAAMTLPGPRQRALPLVLFALVLMALTGVDHAPVSLPRIQLLPLLLLLPVAASAFPELLRASRPLLGLLLLLYVGGALYSASLLFSDTNESHEERLWRDAQALMDSGPICLATLGYGDPPEAGLSPRHTPAYLVEGHGAQRSVRHLGALDRLKRECQGPVYVLLGMRCHVAMREPGEPAPGAQGLPICREVRARGDLEPLIERKVKNWGDLAYPMYPNARELSLGLYKVAR